MYMSFLMTLGVLFVIVDCRSQNCILTGRAQIFYDQEEDEKYPCKRVCLSKIGSQRGVCRTAQYYKCCLAFQSSSFKRSLKSTPVLNNIKTTSSPRTNLPKNNTNVKFPPNDPENWTYFLMIFFIFFGLLSIVLLGVFCYLRRIGMSNDDVEGQGVENEPFIGSLHQSYSSSNPRCGSTPFEIIVSMDTTETDREAVTEPPNLGTDSDEDATDVPLSDDNPGDMNDTTTTMDDSCPTKSDEVIEKESVEDTSGTTITVRNESVDKILNTGATPENYDPHSVQVVNVPVNNIEGHVSVMDHFEDHNANQEHGHEEEANCNHESHGSSCNDSST